jgi:hypothetical protein
VPPPSTKAATGIGQKAAASASTMPAIAATAAARIASAPIIRCFRFHRSAASPPGSAKTASGSVRAKPTMPAFAGEPVSASTSSG